MTLQEIISSLNDLSMEDKTSLLNILESQLSQHHQKDEIKHFQPDSENFWDMTLRFRERMEKEGIEFTDEDFANLRDRSPGKEVEL